MNTLPDYLRPGLRLISVGLNPSLPSVAAGFYFANPRNRFWRVLNASGLVKAPLTPSVAAMRVLLERDRIGFTDVVKRASRGGGELRAADYRRDAPELAAKLRRFEPEVAWFHGKQAFGLYLRYGEGRPDAKIPWGGQKLRIGTSRVFVTPNPSPANAVFSLDDLMRWYDALARFAG